MFKNLFFTDFARVPRREELNDVEKREVDETEDAEAVQDVLKRNALLLAKQGFRMQAGMPFCSVDALDDGTSLMECAGLRSDEVHLAIFNGPNHGTYGVRGQTYGRTPPVEFGAYAFMQ